jgi:elongation factor P
MTTTNDLKNGMILKIDGNLWKILEFQHVKPGKGGAFVRTKLKNITSGKVIDRTYNAGTKVENVTVDRREMQFLYKQGNEYVFMDLENYNQINISETVVDNAKNFLIDGSEVTIAMFEDNPIYISMPHSVILKIIKTDPGLQGNRSNAGNKSAVVETGYKLQVPLFINENDNIKIDTLNGEYISKA